MTTETSPPLSTGPLSNLKVIEICSTIAGPACTRLLADFGADVIKIEPPEGDPVRQMGQHFEDQALYASSILRNKRSITLDLKNEHGRQVARDLIARADILVENNRPGVMERLGLGYEALSAINPGLVMVRISGYGQDGPYSDRPGYGAICEAVGGVRHMTGDPDRPPARVALVGLRSIWGHGRHPLAPIYRPGPGGGCGPLRGGLFSNGACRSSARKTRRGAHA
jgi:crotonobetainyl-CoA:carnitine CoA-transferase CaiB-like acyl-CoA transferase